MNIALTIFFVLSLVGMLLFAYMIFRNHRVFRYRANLLNQCQSMDDLLAFKQLPGYDTMLFRFWVWPMSRFAEKKDA